MSWLLPASVTWRTRRKLILLMPPPLPRMPNPIGSVPIPIPLRTLAITIIRKRSLRIKPGTCKTGSILTSIALRPTELTNLLTITVGSILAIGSQGFKGHHRTLEDLVPLDWRARARRLEMPCCHPFKAFDTGCVTDNGKTDYLICPSTAGNLLDVASAEKRGKHISPSAPLVKINGHTYLKDPVAIPCGTCVGCRMDRAKQWKVRVCHEMELYDREDVHFVTLTYRDECLPHTKYGEPCLRKEDLQLFLKRLRNPNRDKSIVRQFRYFACGEYGTAENGTRRPHFHVILFGKLDDLVPYKFKHFHSKSVGVAWKFGLHDIEPVYPESVAYVCGYTEKKQVDSFFDSYPVKPFLMMSTHPAIGSYYVSRLKGSSDRKVYGNFGKVHDAPIPRAYLKKCEDQPWYPEFKEKSKEIAADTLRTNLAAAHTDQEEKLGDLQEKAALKRLEKLRKVVL